MIRPSRLFPVWFALCAMVWAADSPRIIYTKSFPGSTPAYVSISVDRSGSVAYKESVDDDPEQFKLDEAETALIFDLAQKLDHFTHPLESGMKVANMGAKTLRWENGSEVSEAKFNYSLDENAKTLHDQFERITDTERQLLLLRRAIRHDKLGIDEALTNIQGIWDRKRLMGAQQFLPLLDHVAGNEIYMHIARKRAAELAEAIRGAKSKAE
jgi:hypothetical protein